MKVAILGAGAFGTALAIALARVGPVTLWARDTNHLQATRESRHLPGRFLPSEVAITSDLQNVCGFDVLLVSVPMQSLPGFLSTFPQIVGKTALVACCKGIELTTLRGPSAILSERFPDATPAFLTGPSFAADIAKGLPTALTLACQDTATGRALQNRLSTPTLRLYRTTDIEGAELGGALKNVIAIACGAIMGAGLGDSARAALMTRGFAEMQRFAVARGAKAETLSGLSGLGDLSLTCHSDLSRNYRFGFASGQGAPFDPTVTVEGAATAQAVVRIAEAESIEMPISRVVAALASKKITVEDAMAHLLSRPLRHEQDNV